HVAEHVREVAYARAPAAVGGEAGRVAYVLDRDRGAAENRASGPAEVAGRGVHSVDQEGDHGAVAAQARAGPAVRGRAVRLGEVASQLADGVGRDAGALLGRLRRMRRG